MLQVVKLPIDFVFFRVRANGAIADPDYLLPGYEVARQRIKERMEAYKAGLVPLPETNAKPRKFSWKQHKGSKAWKSKQGKLPSIDYAQVPGAAAEERGIVQTYTTKQIVGALRGGQNVVEKSSKQLEASKPTEKNAPQTKQPASSGSQPQKEVDPQSEEWDNSIAVCAIMKQEKLNDIREWLLYHQCALAHATHHQLGQPSCDCVLLTSSGMSFLWRCRHKHKHGIHCCTIF